MDVKDKPADAEVIAPVALVRAEIPQPPPRAAINARVQLGTGVLFQSMAEVFSVADAIRKSGAGPPKATTGMIATSILKGQALGLDVVTSMGNIAVINGRASLGGDIALGVLRRSGLLAKYVREWVGVEGSDSYGCKITMARKDTGEQIDYTFTFGEAKKAGLCRTSMWTAFTKRMVYYRTLGFVCRDLFSDVLNGTYIREELEVEGGPAAPESSPAPDGGEAPAVDPFFEATEAPKENTVEPLESEGPGTPTSPQEAADDPGVAEGPSEAPAASPEPEAAQGDPSSEVAEGGIVAIFDGLVSTFAQATQAEAATRDPFEGFRDDKPVPEKIVVKPSARKEKAVRRPKAEAAPPATPTSTVTLVRNADSTMGKSKRLF